MPAMTALRRLALYTAIGTYILIVVGAIVLDVLVLGAFVWVKASVDPLGLWVAAAGIVLVVLGERLFMASHARPDGTMDMCA